MSKLISRTLSGFLTLMVILALLLFISAGTLAYSQAWVYLAVFAGCVILITAYLIKYDRSLLESRLNAGPSAETEKSQKVIQSLASIFFVAIYIVAGLDFRFHWSHMSGALSALGEVLVALGFFIVFLVFKENSHTSAVIEVTADQKVISSGPYRVVRHPMYSGALLMLIASGLALGSWVAIPFVLPMIVAIGARLLNEEKFLAERLTGYQDYCQKVRYHLVPFIW